MAQATFPGLPGANVFQQAIEFPGQMLNLAATHAMEVMDLFNTEVNTIASSMGLPSLIPNMSSIPSPASLFPSITPAAPSVAPVAPAQTTATAQVAAQAPVYRARRAPRMII